jgi:hypothetical protein
MQALLTLLPGVISVGETYYMYRLLGQFDRWLHHDATAELKWHKRLVLAKRKTHRILQRSIDHAFLDADDSPRLHRHLTGRGYIREFCRVMDRTARRRDGHAWVEKTPDHLAYAELLAREIPDAQFLHVVRHGEDVLASAVDGQMRYSEHEVFGGSIPHWVTRWNRAAEVHMRLAGHPRHTVIPYECLFTADTEVRALLRSIAGVEGAGDAADGGPCSRIADLDREPWKRGSTGGSLKPPTRKFERLFGVDTQAWIRAHLTDYGQVVSALAAAQPQYPWMAGALRDHHAPETAPST